METERVHREQDCSSLIGYYEPYYHWNENKCVNLQGYWIEIASTLSLYRIAPGKYYIEKVHALSEGRTGLMIMFKLLMDKIKLRYKHTVYLLKCMSGSITDKLIFNWNSLRVANEYRTLSLLSKLILSVR